MLRESDEEQGYLWFEVSRRHDTELVETIGELTHDKGQKGDEIVGVRKYKREEEK